jgi:hypothetical protein
MGWQRHDKSRRSKGSAQYCYGECWFQGLVRRIRIPKRIVAESVEEPDSGLTPSSQRLELLVAGHHHPAPSVDEVRW